jgi:hypothetical protein
MRLNFHGDKNVDPGVVTPCSLVFYPEDSGDMFLRIVGNHLQDDTVSKSRRPQSTLKVFVCFLKKLDYV